MELGESQENGIKADDGNPETADTESCKGIANDHSAGWPFEGSALARTRRVSSFKANYQKAAETAEKWRSLRADDWDPMMVGGHWAIGGRGYQVGGHRYLGWRCGSSRAGTWVVCASHFALELRDGSDSNWT
ncbi:unnamed protein product [Durusdinium trenchii]|uniref:Uncharacterized protein n=1 Tax=Durusdinium trenchii TaxID=1381693 RepID=A0ABP0JY70_9DINO